MKYYVRNKHIKLRYQDAWRNRDHKYFWFRNYGTMVALHVGPIEFFYMKGKR
jgi:hypothetical protein